MKRFAAYVTLCSFVLALGVPVIAGSTSDNDKPDTTKVTGTFLAGEIGFSPRWGSGWLDLAEVTNFAKGDRLRLRIGGTAEKILVRLLPKGEPPDLSVGLVSGAFTVPENRVVEVVLSTDRKGIVQISVHGGPNPWGKFPLGAGNGPATIEGAELVSATASPSSQSDSSRTSVKFLAGEIGFSSRWGSGWLDLAEVTNFAKGDRLRLRIGGTAEKILVRLLPKGEPPDLSVGLVSGAFTVPENRVVEVVLSTDRKGIVQISVHGGPNPWGKFPLGAGNGPATIEGAELVTR